jgi:hypothetical protein
MDDSVLTSDKCFELIIERFKELLSDLSPENSINFWNAGYIGLPHFLCLNKKSQRAIATGNADANFDELENNIIEMKDSSDYEEFRERFIENFIIRYRHSNNDIDRKLGEEFNYRRMNLMMKVPTSFYEKFIENESPDNRWGMLTYPKLPSTIIEKYTTSPDIRDRVALSYNLSLPIDLMEKFAGDSNDRIRSAIAQNIRTPEEILTKLSGDTSNSVRRSVAGNPSTPFSILQNLAKDKNKTIRRDLTYNSNCTPDILRYLANDKDVEVKCGVAQNHKTTLDVLVALPNDVRIPFEAFVANRNTPEGVFIALESINGDDFLVSKSDCKDFASHPNCSASILAKLADNDDVEVRTLVAQHSKTPDHVLEKLSSDGELVVRLLLLNNEKIDEKLAGKVEEKLLKSISKIHIDVRREIAEKRNSVRLQRFLLNDKNIKVLKVIAGNHAICQECLEQLASRDNPELLEIIAENPNCPDSVIERLAASSDPKYRRTVGLISPCSESAKFKAYNDEMMVKYVAHDPLSPELLQKLASEGIDVVRDAAKKNPAYPSWSADINEAGQGHSWIEDQLETASPAIQKAVKDGDILFYCGKNATNDILVKSPVVSFLALKAATSIPSQWLARVAQSEEWIVRAAVACRAEMDGALRSKMIEDTHPVVSFLAIQNT